MESSSWKWNQSIWLLMVLTIMIKGKGCIKYKHIPVRVKLFLRMQEVLKESSSSFIQLSSREWSCWRTKTRKGVGSSSRRKQKLSDEAGRSMEAQGQTCPDPTRPWGWRFNYHEYIGIASLQLHSIFTKFQHCSLGC